MFCRQDHVPDQLGKRQMMTADVETLSYVVEGFILSPASLTLVLHDWK